MRREEGEVIINGSIAYAPQNPWYVIHCIHLRMNKVFINPPCRVRIMSASVRDNIIFSHEYDESFYNLVLDGKRTNPI